MPISHHLQMQCTRSKASAIQPVLFLTRQEKTRRSESTIFRWGNFAFTFSLRIYLFARCCIDLRCPLCSIPVRYAFWNS